MIENTVINLVYSKLNILPTEEILLQQIFSVISFSMSSKTKMVRFYLKNIIILIIIPKFRWPWDYRKLIIVIFTFKCMILTRVKFDIEYFEKLILKLNEFDKNFMLSGTFLQRQIKMKTINQNTGVVFLLQKS